MNGKNLPEALSGFREKISKAIGLGSNIPNAERGRKRSDVKENSTSSSFHPDLFNGDQCLK
jgi:hypothetical protein